MNNRERVKKKLVERINLAENENRLLRTRIVELESINSSTSNHGNNAAIFAQYLIAKKKVSLLVEATTKMKAEKNHALSELKNTKRDLEQARNMANLYCRQTSVLKKQVESLDLKVKYFSALTMAFEQSIIKNEVVASLMDMVLLEDPK